MGGFGRLFGMVNFSFKAIALKLSISLEAARCQTKHRSGHIKKVGSQPILFFCSLKNESNASITTLFIIVLLADA